MLAAIDAKRVDGVFAGTLSDVPAGQAQAVELLEQAFERAHALLENATEMDSHLKVEVFEPLVKHKRRESFSFSFFRSLSGLERRRAEAFKCARREREENERAGNYYFPFSRARRGRREENEKLTPPSLSLNLKIKT